ncbi:MAG: MAPEG family protein [Pseudomonadota bacterium]
MSGEMLWLGLTVLLALMIWIPYTTLYAGIAGFPGATYKRPPIDELPEWAKCMHRAHMNLLEVLVPFAILVLMLKTLGKTDAGTATAAAVFFFARVAHAVVYPMSIPFVRTLAFAVSWLCCLYLLYRAFAG